MAEKEVKTVKVSESTARDWEQYVEENTEVDSLSHLIRLAVTNHISGNYDITQRQSGETDSVSGEVLTSLRSIETSLDDLDTRLDSIEEIGRADAGFSLEKALYYFLPETGVPPHAPESFEQEDFEGLDDVYSSRDLANRLGADIREVEKKLKKIAEEANHVHIWEAESGLIYAWREVQ